MFSDESVEVAHSIRSLISPLISQSNLTPRSALVPDKGNFWVFNSDFEVLTFPFLTPPPQPFQSVRSPFPSPLDGIKEN